jgi:hypothetical protein
LAIYIDTFNEKEKFRRECDTYEKFTDKNNKDESESDKDTKNGSTQWI